ncbi:MAG: hypothetical protein ABUS79_02425 [Pseudomonadota bacterium]
MSVLGPVFSALNRASARYVVVGGVATVLHGFPRLTADLDLVVDLDPPQALRTMEALASLGLRPRAPVSADAFADEAQRRSWIADKGMRVFSLWDPASPMREVDVFVDNPIPFLELWQRSTIVTLAGERVPIASISDLIALKRLANRPSDLQDIEALLAIAAKGPKA